jgi:cytochrome c-type biogenesis protein
VNDLLTSLGRAVEGSSPVVGLCAALIWGILSILLSPCHLASIPLLVGYISKDPEVSPKRAFRISASFAAGVLVAVSALGIITLSAGRIAGDIGKPGGIILAILLMLFGLNLMEVFALPAPRVAMPGRRRSGLLGSALYGLVFGAAAGPCTFAFIAPLLGVVLAAQAVRPALSAAMLGCFVIGHCGVIVAAGTFSGTVGKLLNWNEKSRVLVILRRVAGALVILAGIYLLRRAA